MFGIATLRDSAKLHIYAWLEKQLSLESNTDGFININVAFLLHITIKWMMALDPL